VKEYLGQYGISASSFPAIAGRHGGNIVVCGDARCIWDDLERFGCHSGNGVSRPYWDFMLVNRLVEVFPGRVDHAYSNVAEVLMRHVRCRRDEYMHEFGMPVACHSRTEGTEWIWPWNGGGSSGLGAILTSLALGYDHIVLAGMPLDESGHNGEPPWRKCRFTTEVTDDDPHWQRAIKFAFEGKVTSMSGRTKLWLGSP
jgi:hypothetical protein